jgi:VanZ family protein
MAAAKNTRVWLPVFLYALLIFSFSSIPGAYVPSLFPSSDRLFHFLEYLPFGFLVLRAFAKTLRLQRLPTLLLALFMVSLYALSDETHQFFIPGRCFDLVDAIFDVIGATSGSLLYLWRK